MKILYIFQQSFFRVYFRVQKQSSEKSIAEFPLLSTPVQILPPYMHCTYDTAFTGEEALRKIKENRYSLILMDVQMQDMDGFEATRSIREIEHEQEFSTPIIAVTAHARKETRKMPRRRHERLHR